MPRIAILLMSQRLIVDAFTNNMSVIDLIERANFTSDSFPEDGALVRFEQLNPAPQILVVWEWLDRTEDRVLVEQRIVTAGGAQHVVPFLEPFHIDRPKTDTERANGRSLWPLEYLPVDKPGGYELQILLNGQVAATYPFTVASVKVSMKAAEST